MIRRQYSLLITLFFLLFLPFCFTFVFSGISNSTYSFFNVTNLTYFNWTSGNITIGSYNDSIQMNINNYTTYINAEYNQKGRIGATLSGYLKCFPNSGTNNVSFIVHNQTSDATNFTLTLNNGSSEEFTLSMIPYCPPGKYYGYFNVTRVGNASDIANVYTTINVPISLNNTFVQNTTNIEGYLSGTFYINNSYHSYYFNTSELNLTTITGLTISLTDLTQDLDVFVFNSSGYLMGKSIQKNISAEKIINLKLPSTSDRWEIRVYGNVSSNSNYRGDLYFSTLNITNVTNETVTLLDFGDLNSNATDSKNFTLTNEDGRVLRSVYQYIEIYRIQTWSEENQTKNFKSFLVPYFAKKIRVMINWTDEAGKNITDWNLYLRDPANRLIGNSTDKFILSNATNATREEFVEFSGPFNRSNEGFWNITVQNATNATMPFCNYTIIAYVWMNETNFTSTNYTNGLNFNRSANYTYDIGINFTVPETQILDGMYEGFLKYNSSQGWQTKLPIYFNVSAGTLVINQTLNNVTIKLADNICFDRLGASALTLNITFNNTGSYDIYYNYNTSNYTLAYGSKNISFTVDNWPSNPINSSSNGIFNITVSINTTNTSNTVGVYKGWIFFNTTNTSNANSTSYPYNTYNLSLELNLTNALDVQIVEVDTGDGNSWLENNSVTYNVTLAAKIFLANGTQLYDDQYEATFLNINNFTSSKMTETNVTSTSYTPTNITQKIPAAASLCDETAGVQKCYINVTTPASMIGGKYNIWLGVQWNNSQSILVGNGTNSSVVVSNTGLAMGFITSSTISLNEGGNTTYLNVSVINLGPQKAMGTIYFVNNSCYAGIVAHASNCSSSLSGMTFSSIDVDGNGTELCTFAWKITSVQDVSSNSPCTYSITTSNTSFNASNSISGTLTVLNVSGGSSSSDDSSGSSSSGSSGTTSNATSKVSGTTNYLDVTDYPTSISIEQGASKKISATIKNTNKTLTQNMILYINNINSSWYSINPSTSVKLKKEETYTFDVTFNIPIDATIGDYSGKFNGTSLYVNPTKPSVSFIYDAVLKSFTLKVTPGQALKTEISTKLSDYSSDMNGLEQQINQSKDQGYNTSQVDSLFDQLKVMIGKANDYVNNGDYNSAYNLLDDISGLINQTRTSLVGMSPITGQASGVSGDWWSWGKWVIIVVVVVGVSIMGYMLWPTKFGETKPAPAAVVQKIVGERKDKIADAFSKLRERWKKIKEKKEVETRGV